jgi:hypothetical protein
MQFNPFNLQGYGSNLGGPLSFVTFIAKGTKIILEGASYSCRLWHAQIQKICLSELVALED